MDTTASVCEGFPKFLLLKSVQQYMMHFSLISRPHAAFFSHVATLCLDKQVNFILH